MTWRDLAPTAAAGRRALRACALVLLLGATSCLSLAPDETVLPRGGVTVEATTPDGRPRVEVLVNGQGPFTFLVDTGVVPVLVHAALAERLGLPALPDASWEGITPDGRVTERRPMVRIETLDVGGARFRGVVAAAVARQEFDGILGMALFADCTLTIDLAAPSVRLGSEPLDPGDPWTVRCDLNDGTPRIPAVVHADSGTFACWPTLDTGAASGFGLPLELADELEFRRTGRAIARTAAGLSQHMHGTAGGTLTVGPGLVVHDWSATLFDGPGLVGVRFLCDYVVAVDARRRLVRIAPRSAD